MADRGTWRLGHRPALDGLRGAAIVLVLLSHSTRGAFAAFGSAGVTIFFVLSGFLITALLLEERQASGRIDLRAFYVRRVRRLLPALAVSTAVFTLVGLVTVGADYVWPGAAAAMLYFGNWVPALGGDLRGFATTWSLAVEEQFYLVWPMLVIAVGRRSRIAVVAAVLGCASVLARFTLLTGGAGADRLHFGTDTAAFALLVGALLATVRLSGSVGRSSPGILLLGTVTTAAVCTWWHESGFIALSFLVVSVAAAAMVWGVTGGRRLTGA